MYFADYVRTAVLFIDQFDQKYKWGSVTLSELWFYVPRALYESKPYEYGLTYIHEALFPGMAELGHTPGVLPWITAYLDFWVVGVFAFGLISGMVRRGVFEAYIYDKSNPLGFILMVQVSIYPVFIYATILITLILASMLALAILRPVRFSSVQKFI